MGRLQRIEGKLERAINGAFARAFKAEVQPVEIASAVRREMDVQATTLTRGRTFVPAGYTVELSSTDYDRLTEYADDLRDELVAAAEEHADTQRYLTKGGFDLAFTKDESLETGVFRILAEESAETDLPAGKSRPRRKPASRTDAPDAPPRPNPARTGKRPNPQRQNTQHPNPQRPNPQRPTPTPGGQRPADRPWLEIDGDRYPLIGPLTVLGRDVDAGIIVDDVNVSRRHSEIRVTTDGPHLIANLKDLGSTNGTWVNGERITSVRLYEGDRITVGQTDLTFHAGRR